MRSPALAMAWELGQRHRTGLLILWGYVAVVAVVIAMLPIEQRSPRLAGMTMLPVWSGIAYLLVVFSFGYETELAGRESCFPSRKFTLPVRTVALVGWPMLFGTLTIGLLWVAAALFIFRACGLPLPVIWPALQLAAILAWTQVVMWSPFGLPWLRAFAAILVLVPLVAGPLYAVPYDVPEIVFLSVLGPLTPIAFVVACITTSRARRGIVPDWRWPLAKSAQRANQPAHRRASFSSAERAQVWFEWRRHGRSLPFLVGVLLPFALFFLFIFDIEMPDGILLTLAGVLLLPPFVAGFAANTVSKSHPQVRDYYGVSAFTATRPMTSAGLVAAKLKMAVLSTLTAWLFVLIALPLALTLSGTWPVVVERWEQWLRVETPLRATVTAVLVALGLVAFTWKQLVQNLYIGLTGREWVIKASVFLGLTFFVAIGPICKWTYEHREYHAALWDVLPWLAGVLVCLKLAATAVLITRLRQRRLVSDQSFITFATGWLLLFIGLFGLLAWLVPPTWAPRYLLALAAILALPLARPAAAPLALAWNRHR
jgi:hypothetical protein